MSEQYNFALSRATLSTTVEGVSILDSTPWYAFALKSDSAGLLRIYTFSPDTKNPVLVYGTTQFDPLGWLKMHYGSLPIVNVKKLGMKFLWIEFDGKELDRRFNPESDLEKISETN